MGFNPAKNPIPAHEIEHIRALHHGVGANEYFHRGTAGAYIGDAVFGANDGIITTFAVVAGVAGAQLSPMIVLILGAANLLGDGFSMAAGNFLARKSEADWRATERVKELWEVEHMPEEERQEVRDIYAAKGFRGNELDRVVEVLTADKNVWVNEMMVGEHGLVAEDDEKNAIKNASVTFIAFVIAGAVPLLPYALGLAGSYAFLLSTLSAGVALFAVGSLRTKVTERTWWLAGLEMLAVGGIAAAVAYGVGALLSHVIGS